MKGKTFKIKATKTSPETEYTATLDDAIEWNSGKVDTIEYPETKLGGNAPWEDIVALTTEYHRLLAAGENELFG